MCKRELLKKNHEFSLVKNELQRRSEKKHKEEPSRPDCTAAVLNCSNTDTPAQSKQK